VINNNHTIINNNHTFYNEDRIPKEFSEYKIKRETSVGITKIKLEQAVRKGWMKAEQEKTELSYRKTYTWSSLVAMWNKKGFAEEGTALLSGFLHLFTWDLVSHKALIRNSEACVSVWWATWHWQEYLRTTWQCIQNMVRHMALARKFEVYVAMHIQNVVSRMALVR